MRTSLVRQRELTLRRPGVSCADARHAGGRRAGRAVRAHGPGARELSHPPRRGAQLEPRRAHPGGVGTPAGRIQPLQYGVDLAQRRGRRRTGPGGERAGRAALAGASRSSPRGVDGRRGCLHARPGGSDLVVARPARRGDEQRLARDAARQPDRPLDATPRREPRGGAGRSCLRRRSPPRARRAGRSAARHRRSRPRRARRASRRRR